MRLCLKFSGGVITAVVLAHRLGAAQRQRTARSVRAACHLLQLFGAIIKQKEVSLAATSTQSNEGEGDDVAAMPTLANLFAGYSRGDRSRGLSIELSLTDDIRYPASAARQGVLTPCLPFLIALRRSTSSVFSAWLSCL
jgi:hypothetical protein